MRGTIKAPAASRRRRPDCFPRDEALRVALALWEVGLDVTPELLQVLLFRLADLLDKELARQRPMKKAVDLVAAMTADTWPGGKWEDANALTEVARSRKLNRKSLETSWLRRKQSS